MGFFDIFRKKKPVVLSTPQNEKSLSIHHKDSKINTPVIIPEPKEIVPANTDIDVPLFKIHHDIKGLIWIGDGKYKNYTKENNYEFTTEVRGVKFTCNYGNEPSIIYTKQLIKKPDDETLVPRPPYSPIYEGLTPEQK
jgi:hypothetical protein